MTEYISAPWRAEYVRKVFKMTGCIFCQALKLERKKAYLLYRGKHNFILLNKYPYTPGHLMIAPTRHLDSIEKASQACAEEMVALLKLSLRILRRKYNPQGFNTGMNIGHSAGAGVADHYHLHVIPRWIGDSNFMPLVGKTKVVIEDLDATFSGLAGLFDAVKKA